MTVSDISKSFLVLAFASLFTACGGSSGSDDSTDGSKVGTNENVVEQPAADSEGEGSLPDAEIEPRVVSVTWDESATSMSNSGLSGSSPMIAISESGNVAAAWVESTSPSSLWGRFFDKAKGEWSDATQLDKGIGNVASLTLYRTNPKVAFVGEVAVVVWQQDGVVYGSIHDENGWSGNPQSIDGIEGTLTAKEISIASLKDGTGAVVAYEYRDDSAPSMLRSSTFSLATKLWSTPVEVAPEITSLLNGIQMLTDSVSGAVYTAWRTGDVRDSDKQDLMIASFLDGSWSEPERVTSDDIGYVTIQADPESDHPVVLWASRDTGRLSLARHQEGSWSISDLGFGKRVDSAVMADGDILIAYQTQNAGAWGSIITQRLDFDTGIWEKKDLTGNEYSVAFPSVATDGNGRAAVVYKNYHTWARDYTEADGWGRSYQPDGLNDGEANTVVMNKAGDAALIWKTGSGDHNVHVLLGH
ncbi:hypothetical protein [Marinobacter sp. VGCF2001]|uniref:hypothetical protein n=1 Tax=Marinobacter sp. VGCF2001 TaxID=3417189 RepID=UPI003CF9DB4B